ncbi:lipid II:glycine glycyltransferase FemX [Patescibacteria group bacterium]
MDAIRDLEREALNTFVSKNPRGHLLQSYEWGVFQKEFGERVHRVGITDNGELVAAATLIRKDFGFGKNYLYCPRGPIVKEGTQEEAVPLLMKEIDDVAKIEGAMFLRANPEYTEKPGWMKGWEVALGQLEPKKTILVDLVQSEDELLAAMKSKTRYNIRLAAKKGVTVESGTSSELLKIFIELNKKTAARDKFTPHSDDYYEKQISGLAKTGQIKIYVAFADIDGTKTPIAANINTFFGRRATYVHGTSADVGRNLMPTFALQWQAIQDAKNAGKTEYDFWGIADSDDPNHPWAGITRFKQGFAGNVVQYIGAYDLVFHKIWYTLYKVSKKVR